MENMLRAYLFMTLRDPINVKFIHIFGWKYLKEHWTDSVFFEHYLVRKLKAWIFVSLQYFM